MRITFTEEEALALLKRLPAYVDLVKNSQGIDVFEEIGLKSPGTIVSSIFEGIRYED